jgi:hypothetical protein
VVHGFAASAILLPDTIPAACDEGYVRELLAAYRLKDSEIGHMDRSKSHVLDAVKVDDAADPCLPHLSKLVANLFENF